MLPELSPLVAPDLICDRCGEKMTKTVVKNQQGRPLHVKYTCKTASTGCAYETLSDVRHNTMQTPIKVKQAPKETEE